MKSERLFGINTCTRRQAGRQSDAAAAFLNLAFAHSSYFECTRVCVDFVHLWPRESTIIVFVSLFQTSVLYKCVQPIMSAVCG